ncbi:MAG: hypothetical protein JWM32_2085 [Verrucomicrobia bacterium]|nr:hypothetical protein [Verrucomicrobiota bacterium]
MDKNLFRDTLNRADLSQRTKILLCLFVDDTPKTLTAIRQVASDAGLREVATWNLTDILKKAKGYAVPLPSGWCLTSAGKVVVEKLFPAAPPAPIIASLRALLPAIKSVDTRDFAEEAIKAYEASLYRSATVLSWVGAVSLLYDHVVAHHLTVFNAEASKRIVDKHGNTLWKTAKSKDDLALMKESTFLDILADLSILGKNVKEHLKNVCLGLRNSSGHPNSFRLGKAQVEAHLEHLVLNVYQKF